MEENVKRSDTRINDYIKDSSENNIQDIRTTPRRLDASFKKMKKNHHILHDEISEETKKRGSYLILEKKLIRTLYTRREQKEYQFI
jgi:hypothetical protein